MTVGTRSNYTTLLTQNMLLNGNASSKSPTLQRFCAKVLAPKVRCVEEDCGTSIGRVMRVPETDPMGLISLDTNARITENYLVDTLAIGTYKVRIRDTSTCLSVGGFCAKCGRGFNARRYGTDTYPVVGNKYVLEGSAAAYQGYLAKRYTGALLGFTYISSDPIPTVPFNWDGVVSDSECNRMISHLRGLGLPSDTANYIRGIEDLLEKALSIVAYYGVYGHVV